MKRLLTSIGLIGVLLTPAAGMAAPDHPMEPGKRMDHLQKELELSDTQRTEIEAIFEAHHQKMKQLREDTEMRINQVLTEEQQAEFEGMREERRERFRDKLKEHRDKRTERESNY